MPHLAHADDAAPRVDMLGTPIEASTTTAVLAPERQGPPAWPVPEIMRRAREHDRQVRESEARIRENEARARESEARARESQARTRELEARATLVADSTPAAASPGYTVPRSVTVTYTGDVPVASDATPHIAMEVTPVTSERVRLLAVSVDPIGFVSGQYGASIARRLNSHAALRIDGQFVRDLDGVDASSTWRLGVSVPLYLSKTFNGPFIEPGLAASRELVGIGSYPLPQTGAPSVYGVRDYAAGPEIFVGWQRLFDNGLHIAAAIGASQDWTGTRTPPGLVGTVYGGPTIGYGSLGVLARPNAETYLRVGYAF